MKQIALKEFRIIKKIDHPNIVKMHEAFFNDSKETMYLVMDLVDGFSLNDFVNKELCTLENAKSIVKQLLQTIMYLHSD